MKKAQTQHTFFTHARQGSSPSTLARLAALAMLALVAWSSPPGGEVQAQEPARHGPTGEAKGIHPGRVVWVYDPQVTDWEGPGKGHWWEANHTKQERVNQMMSQALRQVAGENHDKAAWDKVFRYHNQARGRGERGYKPGEKLAIKVNWVGLIFGQRSVNPDTYNLDTWRDYMNTSPQMIVALLRQLVEQAGVKQSDISVGDTLANLPNEYYQILHGAFPEVNYLDHDGKFGRTRMVESKAPLYWSSRPQGRAQDYAPAYFAEADYLINFANLKAHRAAGVTLCAKNHYGSLVRGPVHSSYFDIHPSAFSDQRGIYRALVDLMGHAHFGGKTVLYLLDGLYSGTHPTDHAPLRWKSAPFNGGWTCSLLASQDPVAIDSVGLDFLQAEYDQHPRKPGAEDYLHEAALASNPPSGTFYDPDHPTNTRRLPSLGVHEHWNNPRQKQYSRNLGKPAGIELGSVGPTQIEK
jgi:hypothetical protein